ncbi:MAG: 4-(cytidine 5'-diphospho)-2-C-methyl-D-erythritol kinase [Desulfatiglandaceae bacterium]
MSPPLITGATVRTPAKLNIRLKVVGLRPDGYHDLVSLMVPVGIFDTLDFFPGPPGITLSCEGTGVPENEENLVFRAARAFFARIGGEPALSISLRKQIPVAAGLGGGSSDAAATLMTLNRMHGTPLSGFEMSDVALGLGADVPFFLHNRPSLATGVGEVLEPINYWPPFWYVIVTPPLAISTAWVYDRLEMNATPSTANSGQPDTQRLELTNHEYDTILASLKKDRPDIRSLLENDLETVTVAHYPVIDAIKKLLMETGAEGALMSGSGPSVFGVFRSEEAAKKAKKAVSCRRPGKVFVAAPYKAAGLRV